MKKSMSVLMAGSILVSSVVSVNPIAYADEKLDYKRLSGIDRYETCAKISQDQFKNSDVAILASGEMYPDALSSGALSIKEKAPLLLVKKNEVPSSIEKEMDRLGVKKVIIVGGENTISKELSDKLEKNYSVERLAGKDRYETSLKVAEKTKFEKNIIVSGKNYADALIATSLSAKFKMNIILTDGTGLIKSLNKDANIILGGKASINIPGIKGKRIAGKDRHETSLKVAEEYFKNAKKSIVSSGKTYADSLSAVSILVKNTQPILLLDKAELAIGDYVKKHKVELTVVGGNSTLDSEVIEKILPEKEIHSSGGGGGSKKTTSTSTEKYVLADGIFRGSAKGRNIGTALDTREKTIDVEIKVENHKITDIKVIRFADDEDKMPKVAAFLAKFEKQIIDNNTTGDLLPRLKDTLAKFESEKQDIDVASGATYSNIAVVTALENAINASKYKAEHNKEDNSKDLLVVRAINNSTRVGLSVDMSDFVLARRTWEENRTRHMEEGHHHHHHDENDDILYVYENEELIPWDEFKEKGIKADIVVDYYTNPKRIPIEENKFEVTEDMIFDQLDERIIMLEFTDTLTGKKATYTLYTESFSLNLNKFEEGKFEGIGSSANLMLNHNIDSKYQVEIDVLKRKINDIRITNYGDETYKEEIDGFLSEILPIIKEEGSVVGIQDEIIMLMVEQNPLENKILFEQLGLLEAIEDGLHRSTEKRNKGIVPNFKDIVIKSYPTKKPKIGEVVDISEYALERRYWDNAKDENQIINAEDFNKEGIYIDVYKEFYSYPESAGNLSMETPRLLTEDMLTTLGEEKYLVLTFRDSKNHINTLELVKVDSGENTESPVSQQNLYRGVSKDFLTGVNNQEGKYCETEVEIENDALKNIKIIKYAGISDDKDGIDEYFNQISEEIIDNFSIIKKKHAQLLNEFASAQPSERKLILEKMSLLESIDNAIVRAGNIINTGESNFKALKVVEYPNKELRDRDVVDIDGLAVEKTYGDTDKNENKKILAKDFKEEGISVTTIQNPYSGFLPGTPIYDDTQLVVKSNMLTQIGDENYLVLLIMDRFNTENTSLYFWKVD